jgi:hypothetical protein
LKGSKAAGREIVKEKAERRGLNTGRRRVDTPIVGKGSAIMAESRRLRHGVGGGVG